MQPLKTILYLSQQTIINKTTIFQKPATPNLSPIQQ